MNSNMLREQAELQRRQLLLVAVTGERAVIPSPSAMPYRHRGGWMFNMVLVAMAFWIVALVTAPHMSRVTAEHATSASQAAPQTAGEIEYFASRFDETSLPRVPQPGQFSLVEGE